MVSLEKLQQYSLSLSLIGLLLPMKISTILVGVFLAISLFSALKKKNLKSISKENFFFAGFFLLFPIALLYSSDVDYGLKVVERNVVWFLIPLLVPFSLQMTKKQLYRAFLAFAIAVHAAALLLIVVACWNFIKTNDPLVFYYDELITVLNFHPVYFSVYLLFSLLILFEGTLKKYIKLPLYVRALIVAFDVVVLVLLSSKIVLASFLLVLGILIFRSYRSKKSILTALLAIVVTLTVVMQFSETRKRINDSLFSSWELLDKETFKYNDPFTGITLRLITWKFVMKKFIEKENVVLGLGTGDAKEFINNVYRERKMDDGGYINYNMHNQYLEYALKFGVLGLLYFFSILFLSFKKAIRTKNGLYFSFLLIFCIFSITESNLEVQRGIVFFVLINSVLYFFSDKKLPVNE
ncbi:O-antigen ligase family protein [Pseudotenacibaculum haliotis]|uniref:O-antigen ligase family protein n=1 Tax=Pseudotenacibaculum haliotis TaxID=1862138 RepID=A0ABW5LPA2_9FLAO